jgi:hypothetical protein
LCGTIRILPWRFFGRACRFLGRPSRGLEHDPEKWRRVFGKDHAQTENQSMILKSGNRFSAKDHAPAKYLDHDPIQLDRIMV